VVLLNYMETIVDVNVKVESDRDNVPLDLEKESLVKSVVFCNGYGYRFY